jgi:hypothetical protein
MSQTQSLLDKEAVTRAHAFGSLDEIAKAEWGAKYNQLLQQRTKLGLDTSAATLNELVYEQGQAQEQDKLRAGADKVKSSHESIVPLMREESTILQGIRQQQELIQQSSFMGADEKSSALLRSYTAELRALQEVIADIQRQKAGGMLDPAQLAQTDQRLQQANFQLQLLQQKVLALQAPLRAELTNWAASFGSTATQVGKTIEGTIGAALQSVNQFLVTGKFNAQALLQQLIQLGLQLVEQMIIQRVMAAINAAAAAGQAAATGPTVAAAWAPAATAATIATQGAAAAEAPAAVALSAALIQGILVAHEGGQIARRMHAGGLAPDEVPVIAQAGEFMIRRDVAQAPGMNQFLVGLNSMPSSAGIGTLHRGGTVTRLHSGGSVTSSRGGGGSVTHVYNFTDLKALTKHMASREGKKIIVDTVRGNRIDLGIG